MGLEPCEQPMFISSTYTITVLWVRHFNCSPCWLRFPAESLVHTAHMRVQRYGYHVLVGFIFRINGLHLTYWCVALTDAYVC